MDAPNTTDIIQAACAIATLSLALYGIIINRKVETLTETNSRLAETVTQLENQTKELGEQTQILADGYYLQRENTAAQRFSMFRLVDARLRLLETYYFFDIENIGVPAHDISIDYMHESLTDKPKANVLKVFKLSPKPHARYRINVEVPDIKQTFQMVLAWKNDAGVSFKQIIENTNGELTLQRLDQIDYL